MDMQLSRGGYSASVKIRLLIGSVSVPVSQMARDHLYLDKPINTPPGKATIFLRVDNSERSWDVFLPNGISDQSNVVALEAID